MNEDSSCETKKLKFKLLKLIIDNLLHHMTDFMLMTAGQKFCQLSGGFLSLLAASIEENGTSSERLRPLQKICCLCFHTT